MSVVILYSPGYGGGWSSDHHGPEEERLFLLMYPGFIEALERQAVHDEAEDEFERPMSPSDYEREDSIEVIEASMAAADAVRRFHPNYASYFHADYFRFVPYELTPSHQELRRVREHRVPARDLGVRA